LTKIREIEGKVLLSHCKDPDSWFGVKYNMNLYRGCQHRCIYCDSRSACYQIEDFDGEVLVKVNAIDLLRKELPSKRVKGTVGTGAMSDPYMPLEADLNLTRQALEVLAQFRYPVHITTKSDLVLKDLDLLCQINQVRASVCFTITTADDELGKKVEPYAPLVSRRFEAARVLAAHGIQVGITMMPILPFIEDSEENIAQIVTRAHECGVTYILPWFGMSIRTGQREYFYGQLEVLFPGLRERYERQFGDRYGCQCPNARRLAQVFHELRERYGIATGVRRTRPQTADQLALF
jgi:DNA repair photolyase